MTLRNAEIDVTKMFDAFCDRLEGITQYFAMELFEKFKIYRSCCDRERTELNKKIEQLQKELTFKGVE